MSRMWERCFIDVDGVVANLHHGLCLAHGFNEEEWPLGEFDLSKVFRIKPTEVWTPDLSTEAFWANLPLLPWADELVRLITNTFGRENVCFLTQPIASPGCYAGKARWLMKEFPDHAFLMGTDKSICAAYDTVLIDDSSENVAKFRARGGQAVLVPRLWNELHSIVDVLGYVNRQLVLGTR